MIEGGFGMRLKNYLNLIKKIYPNFIYCIAPKLFYFFKLSESNNNIFIYFKKHNIFLLSLILKNSFFFRVDTLNDISVTDLISPVNRFKLSYNFLSLSNYSRIFLSTFISEADSVISLRSVFKSST